MTDTIDLRPGDHGGAVQPPPGPRRGRGCGRRDPPRRSPATPARGVFLSGARRAGRPRRRQWRRQDHTARDHGRAAAALGRGRAVRRRRRGARRRGPNRLRPPGRHHPPRPAAAPHVALRGRPTVACGHRRGRDRAGRRRGPARPRPRRPVRRAGGQPVGRAAQAGEHRGRAAHPASPALPRRTHVGPRPVHVRGRAGRAATPGEPGRHRRLHHARPGRDRRLRPRRVPGPRRAPGLRRDADRSPGLLRGGPPCAASTGSSPRRHHPKSGPPGSPRPARSGRRGRRPDRLQRYPSRQRARPTTRPMAAEWAHCSNGCC